MEPIRAELDGTNASRRRYKRSLANASRIVVVMYRKGVSLLGGMLRSAYVCCGRRYSLITSTTRGAVSSRSVRNFSYCAKVSLPKPAQKSHRGNRKTASSPDCIGALSQPVPPQGGQRWGRTMPFSFKLQLRLKWEG